jgi:hypothetical protein
MLGQWPLKYLNLTIVLPDGRLLLQRREVGYGSFLPWGCTIERVVDKNETASAMARRILQQFNFYSTEGTVAELFPIHTRNLGTIIPVVAKCKKMLTFKAPKQSNFMAMGLIDIEEEMGTFLLNITAAKHSFSDRSISVIRAFHQRGIIYEQR